MPKKYVFKVYFVIFQKTLDALRKEVDFMSGIFIWTLLNRRQMIIFGSPMTTYATTLEMLVLVVS
jgi:hypothetical protein